MKTILSVLVLVLLAACAPAAGLPAYSASTPTAATTAPTATLPPTTEPVLVASCSGSYDVDGESRSYDVEPGKSMAYAMTAGKLTVVCDLQGHETISFDVKPVVTDVPPTSTPTAVPPTSTPTVDVSNLLAQPPFETKQVKNDAGQMVTVLKGFDVTEFGGNDSKCTRTETETIHLGEVVSSENESCLIVVEWSLKHGADTVVTGVYAVKPGEWFYVPLAYEGINDNVRIVGTIWYLPRGWNSHMLAADLASDRDFRDGTTSYVGLSPTDPWVESVAKALAGK